MYFRESMALYCVCDLTQSAHLVTHKLLLHPFWWNFARVAGRLIENCQFKTGVVFIVSFGYEIAQALLMKEFRMLF